MALQAQHLQHLLQLHGTSGAALPQDDMGHEQSNLITSLHPDGKLLAVAGEQRLVVASLEPVRNGTSYAVEDFQVQEVCVAPERVSDAVWLSFARPSSRPAAEGDPAEDMCLAVATSGPSGGWLQLHSPAGLLMHRQRLHLSAIERLRPRLAGMGLNPGDQGESLTVVFAHALGVISALDMRALLRLQRQHWAAPTRTPPLPFHRWDLPKSGARSDGLCAGLKPVSLYAALRDRQSAPKVALMTAGQSPPFAVYEAHEQEQRSALAAVAGLASSAASSLRGWLPSPLARQPSPERPTRAEVATPHRVLQDDPARIVTSLLLAPRGCLAVATDSLGRLLLIDAASMAVVRVLKGFRDAQCAWMMLEEQQPLTALPHAADAGSAKQQQQQLQPRLHLVVYAPLRGVVELWAMRHGPRVASIPCGPSSRLLQPAVAFGRGRVTSGGGGAEEHDASDCLLLDFATGQLQSLRQLLRSATAHVRSEQ